MSKKTCFDSNAPRLAESALIRYLEKIFSAKGLSNNLTYDSAIQDLVSRDIPLPPGLNPECAVVYKIVNVISTIWNLSSKSALYGVLMELGEQPYLLCSDLNTPGADSLYLITSTASESNDYSWICNDVKGIVEDLFSINKTKITKFVVGGFKTDDTLFQCVGIQLTSLI